MRQKCSNLKARYGMVLFCVMIIPPITGFLESTMFLHMLVQLPLLIFSGWLMGKEILKKFSSFFDKWNANGVPGIIMVLCITTYWMLPRALDDALTVWYVELFKFISLPFLGGLLFRESWNKLQTIGKSFVYLNYLPMFGLMAWLYMDLPIQLCNNYLEYEQKSVGWGFLVLTMSMVLYFVQLVFTDQSETK